MSPVAWFVIGVLALALLAVLAAKFGLLTVKLGPAAKPRTPKEPTS